MNAEIISYAETFFYAALGLLASTASAIMLLRYAPKFVSGIKPVHIDGMLWVGIAIFGAMQGMLTTDEAYKYVPPSVLFWMKFSVMCAVAGCGALKAFRSTSYAGHLQDQKDAADPIKPSEELPTKQPPQPAGFGFPQPKV